jgi:aminomethyltransferase
MERAVDAPLKRTPLFARHRASTARMTTFAGWEMPETYSGIAAEHLAVRTRAGLFDFSHLGEIEIAGSDSLDALQQLMCTDLAQLRPGHTQYSALLTSGGTFLDDVVVFSLAPRHFLVVVNASNIDRDHAWISERLGAFGDAVAVNVSARYALLAIQGPASEEVLQPLTGIDLPSVKPHAFSHGEVAAVRATVSRTGYTGEEGFELLVPPQSADRVWLAILDAGRSVDLVPAGLGACDTLRLEAGMRLYGYDLNEETTPLEAGLDWMVCWAKDSFSGKAALRRQQSEGVQKKLVGFELMDSGIARPGHRMWADGSLLGRVTSGTRTPFLKKAIGMGYVSAAHAVETFEVEIRHRRVRARVVPMPFYRRQRPFGA